MNWKEEYDTAMNACLLFVGAFLAIAAVDRAPDAYRYGLGAIVLLLSVWLAFWLGRWDSEKENADKDIANDLLTLPGDENRPPRFVVKKAMGTDGFNVYEEGVGVVCFCFDDTGREAKIIAELLNKRGGL